MMPHPFDRYRELIDDWAAFAEALERPLPTCIWANPLKIEAGALHARLARQDIALRPLAWREGAWRLPEGVRPGHLLEYLVGLYHVQEEVSMIPVHLLAIAPGQRVVDLCAAPGNKTVQIGALLANRGTLVANDRDFRRMRAVRRALDRLGVYNVTMTNTDAAQFPLGENAYDRVLADVPCSCEGTSRKNPELLYKGERPCFDRLALLQTQILRRAFRLCRPGGRVVYSTCTYAPEENELVVQSLLDEAGEEGARLLPASFPGLHTSPGLTHWKGRALHPDMAHAVRVYPHHNDTGGFFLAVIEKLATTGAPLKAPTSRES